MIMSISATTIGLHHTSGSSCVKGTRTCTEKNASCNIHLQKTLTLKQPCQYVLDLRKLLIAIKFNHKKLETTRQWKDFYTFTQYQHIYFGVTFKLSKPRILFK